MDRTTMARKLREALFDHIETERRDALQDSAIDQLFEKVLASWSKPSEELCRTWTSQQVEIAPQPTCQCKPDTTNCGICWDKTATPAIGDVDLNTASVYGCKDGTAQWVSIHDPMFDAVMDAAEKTV
jgi:hypothetical protein